jgi:quinol monooxygenase YgiN
MRRWEEPVYGLIAKMKAVPGERDRLADIMLGIGSMPGCQSYIVARDHEDPTGLWITEVWDSAADHAASLALPAVQAAIEAGRPLIAGFETRIETEPVGGSGSTNG